MGWQEHKDENNKNDYNKDVIDIKQCLLNIPYQFVKSNISHIFSFFFKLQLCKERILNRKRCFLRISNSCICLTDVMLSYHIRTYQTTN